MKTPIATMAVLGTLAASCAWAQTGGPTAGGPKPDSAPTAARDAKDAGGGAAGQGRKIFPNATSLPEPTPADEIAAPSIELPNAPIEPWLLTKEAGPFMVLAKTFRGPESERMALALAMELRNRFGLPAYILRSKDFPGRSNIRGIPPTSDPQVVQASVSVPEKYRTYDEAAVLVGNEKTEKDAAVLLHKVKKIKPDCLNGMPHLFKWREGLSMALRTTNPYIPAQQLYPHKHDRLIVQMNQGPRSIAHCPGQFSLQVAEFTGRSTFNDKDDRFLGLTSLSLKKSPLATAADDAERLADKLSKNAEFQRLGQPVYVYHDRAASRVYVGAFSSHNDSNAVDVRDALLKMAIPLVTAEKKKAAVLDTMIVPAGVLTELKDIKSHFEQ
ncbi:MAG: hypothetical protein U0790_04625 [Isosphaeraceae bacterium]